MICLLTGGSGFLGSIIAKTISKENKLYILSRNYGQFQISLEQQVPNFSYKFDLVIHSAGKAHSIPINEYDQNEFFKINVIGTQNLLKGLEKCGLPEKFIFISSVSVYGRESGSYISEETPLQAKDAYGLSKIQAEQIVIDWCKRNNIICTILRLPLIVGLNPPGNLGAMLKAIKMGYYFNIAGGNAKKSMVLATDVAKYVLAASEKGGIYNLTDGCHPTFNEFSHALALQLGKKYVPNIPFFFANLLAKIGDFMGDDFLINSKKISKITSSLTFDDTKAREAFNWHPKSVLDELMFRN